MAGVCCGSEEDASARGFVILGRGGLRRWLRWCVSPVCVTSVFEKFLDFIVGSHLPSMILMMKKKISIRISISFIRRNFGSEWIDVGRKRHVVIYI